MNAYEQKQEAKRARLARAADRAKAEGESKLASARKTLDMIPLGQPILVGHHSEKRHRRDIARTDAKIRAGFAALEKSAELARRAEAVGTGGISSDDPDAIAKLREQLDALNTRREHMKIGNAAYRKAKTYDDRRAVLESLGMSETGPYASKRRAQMSYYPPGKEPENAYLDADLPPFPKYTLTNLGANIRRIEGRIADLKKRAAAVAAHEAAQEASETARTRAATPETSEAPGAVLTSPFADLPIEGPAKHGGTFRVEVRTDLNRIALKVSDRMPRETFQTLRRNGWRWAPSEGAFLFGLNAGGVWRAKEAARILRELTVQS